MAYMIDTIKRGWKTFLFGLFAGLLSVPLILLLNQPQTSTPIALLPPPPTITPVPLRVHITGAVNAPGVYQLPRQSIVQEAIDAAGGLTVRADPSGLNLAGLLGDGQQLFIPEQPPTALPTATVGPGTPTPEPPTPTAPAVQSAGTGVQPADTGVQPNASIINLNTATQAELESLPRIGPSIAGRIVEYRTLNGPFTDVEQIMNVSGIGPATFNAIKDFITVK
jgi:competence protein ComEA